MGKSKPRTEEQIRRADDARLKRTYNITSEDREYLEKKKDGKCWISGRPPGTRRLSVDHDHSWKKVKIDTIHWEEGWTAYATYNGVEYTAYSRKKSLAICELKRKLLRASVRGLLSYNINAGLQKFSDSPELLRAAADYLENFQKGSPLGQSCEAENQDQA